MADKIYEDDELIAFRFSCECMWAGHSMEIELELADKQVVGCFLNLYMDGRSPLKYRLKQIWKLLKGEDSLLADFCIRPRDVPQIIELLSRVIASPYNSTWGTTTIIS